MGDPPYGIIVKLLRQSNVIPFLGAGASLSGRPAGAAWDPRTSPFLPTGSELSRYLADDAQFPQPNAAWQNDPKTAKWYYRADADRDDLAKVASYYAEESADRATLIEFIHQTFNREYQLGEIHRLLADVDAPLLIVTTNYDDLIERAFREKNKPYHLVAYPTDRKELAASVLWWKPGASDPEPYPPKNLPLSLTDTTIIYKMHGTVDRAANKWDSFVITEEDYVDFLARMTGQTAIPARFFPEFRKRRFLFLGYGLQDWNFRVMLKEMRAALSTQESAADDAASADLRSWAIQRDPSELEQALWAARKVKIYDMDIDAFVAKLREWWNQ